MEFDQVDQVDQMDSEVLLAVKEFRDRDGDLRMNDSDSLELDNSWIEHENDMNDFSTGGILIVIGKFYSFLCFSSFPSTY